jgi:hypothetical protein
MSFTQPLSWHVLERLFHHWNEAYQWPLYFVIGWITIYVRRWRRRRDEDAAQGWPSIEGRINAGKVSGAGHTSRFLATLDYSFFLDQYHYGKYTHEFAKKAEAEEFVRQMKDKRVQIRYNQSNPDRSVLEQSVIEQHVMLAPRFG